MTSIAREQGGWGRSDAVEFFSTSRTGVESLYLSERLVLPPLARASGSVLDIGCAAGGFVSVFHHYNPAARYVGIDVVHRQLRAARAAHPEKLFAVNDGATLPFRDGAFDLVWSSGILHLNSAYEAIVRDAWRVARRWLACDFRLSLDDGRHVGEFDIEFGAAGSAAVLPYHVMPTEELLALLKSLKPAPSSIGLRGYPSAVAPNARGVPGQVVMAFAVIEKGAAGIPSVTIDIRQKARFTEADE